MGCTSSRSIDPGYISAPIPIPSSAQHPLPHSSYGHSYPPPPQAHSGGLDRSNAIPLPPSRAGSGYHPHAPPVPQLRPYQFPTQSFAPRDLPPGHPFANPYEKYMP
ncbi:uncharacterized protein I303_105282 [Kwoniella dejecticola CBS 10117]|uniref:Uncharacterized protein n=1 Tax=Kwoniella dejecticola CBS 10117 TaxID=1296121 RepID=A0A1A6A2X1_9TREE|nr:uncharacterized protein I303_05270 [Kwoniella dejecticola CBS 10117]OBR84412.1 hypothetical protein I303_05270 [Kwoniella dejecticola CBS 10117]